MPLRGRPCGISSSFACALLLTACSGGITSPSDRDGGTAILQPRFDPEELLRFLHFLADRAGTPSAAD